MATKNWAITYSRQEAGKGVTAYQWVLVNGDDGLPLEVSSFADKTVQVKGTFGSGGTIVIEGSNDAASGAIYATLNDPQGNALSITAAKIETILENPRILRPRVTAGDGDTSLTITVLVRK